MELGFASLVVIRVGLLYALDGIVFSRSCVNGAIDDAKRPRSQDRLNPKCSVVDRLAQKLGHRRMVWH